MSLGEEITKWWARGRGEDSAASKHFLIVHREVPIHIELSSGGAYRAYVVTPEGYRYLVDGHSGASRSATEATAKRMLDLVLAGHELVFSFDGDICVLVADDPLPRYAVVFENPRKKAVGPSG